MSSTEEECFVLLFVDGVVVDGSVLPSVPVEHELPVIETPDLLLPVRMTSLALGARGRPVCRNNRYCLRRSDRSGLVRTLSAAGVGVTGASDH